MSQYEVLYIINPNTEEEPRNALIEKFNQVITSGGGTVDEVDIWGKRRLAYLIDDLSEGFYVRIMFTCDPQLPQELERNFRISDEVMRYMVVNIDK